MRMLLDQITHSVNARAGTWHNEVAAHMVGEVKRNEDPIGPDWLLNIVELIYNEYPLDNCSYRGMVDIAGKNSHWKAIIR